MKAYNLPKWSIIYNFINQNKIMEILNKIKGWLGDVTELVMALFSLAIFAELLFGQFLGGFSVVGNFIEVVGQFGEKGFVGLIAMLLILHMMNKKA